MNVSAFPEPFTLYHILFGVFDHRGPVASFYEEFFCHCISSERVYILLHALNI